MRRKNRKAYLDAYEAVKDRSTDQYTAEEFLGLMLACGVKESDRMGWMSEVHLEALTLLEELNEYEAMQMTREMEDSGDVE